jgi:hypothetical protein
MVCDVRCDGDLTDGDTACAGDESNAHALALLIQSSNDSWPHEYSTTNPIHRSQENTNDGVVPPVSHSPQPNQVYVHCIA